MSKVTKEQIDSKIVEVKYSMPHGTITICVIVLENGYTVQGMSACVDPAIFDQKIGEAMAYEDAYNKIWPLEGYLLAQRLHEAAEEETHL
jgi:hypothetical protein